MESIFSPAGIVELLWEKNMENRAFVLTAIRTMEKRTIPMPTVGDDDVLIKVRSVGICGSDLHYYDKGNIGDFIVEFPFILGHEAAGDVVEVGKNVKHLKVGDRVCMEPGIPCYHCTECLSGYYNLCKDVRFWATPPYDGCLCDYVVHPAAFTFPIPETMSYTEGALVEPMAIGLHAANTGSVKLGQTVAIIGAGTIGLVTALAAKAYGATKIIIGDVLDKRLAKATEFGCIAVNTKNEDFVQRVLDETDGRGADVVIDCAGFSETVANAIKAAAPAATVILVGLGADKFDGVPSSPISTKELTIKSIFRYRNLYPTAVNAIASGLIPASKLVSHRFSFEDSAKAFAVCLDDIKNVVKGVIEY